MSIRHGALALLVLCLAAGAQAQTAAPAKADAKPDAKSDKSDPKAEEAAAAMERAKRLAAGPMRVILEASKGKRREAEPAAAPAAAESGSLRTVSVRAAPAPEATTRPAPVPQAAPAAVPAVQSEPAPQPAPAPPPAAAVSTQITLSSNALQSHSVAPVPGLERSGTAAAVPAVVSAAPAVLPKLPDAFVKPRLVSRVDPELPQRLLDDLGRNAVVSVDLTIRPDGKVAGVGMVTAVPPRVQRALVAALEQWRFDPLPSERVHRVELVFNGE